MRVWLPAAAVLAIAFASDAAPAQPVAEVTRTRGYAAVERASEITPLTIGDAVQIGETVVTGADGRLRLVFVDGSLITLGNSSRLMVTWFSHDGEQRRRLASLDLTSGIVRAEVADVGPDSGFDVRMPIAVASVRGTDLVATMDPASAAVVTVAGEVWVTPRITGDAILMTDGWGIDVRAPDGDGEPYVLQPWDDQRVQEMLERTDLE